MRNSRKCAVALQYPEGAEAPFISAVAKGPLAQKLIVIAEEHDIPVVKDEVTANVLSMQEAGTCIPAETWQAVAGIFAFVIGLEDKKI